MMDLKVENESTIRNKAKMVENPQLLVIVAAHFAPVFSNHFYLKGLSNCFPHVFYYKQGEHASFCSFDFFPTNYCISISFPTMYHGATFFL